MWSHTCVWVLLTLTHTLRSFCKISSESPEIVRMIQPLTRWDMTFWQCQSFYALFHFPRRKCFVFFDHVARRLEFRPQKYETQSATRFPRLPAAVAVAVAVDALALLGLAIHVCQLSSRSWNKATTGWWVLHGNQSCHSWASDSLEAPGTGAKTAFLRLGCVFLQPIQGHTRTHWVGCARYDEERGQIKVCEPHLLPHMHVTNQSLWVIHDMYSQKESLESSRKRPVLKTVY